MTDETRKLLVETTELLKGLDHKSLELIRTGAELLRMRDTMDLQEKRAG